MDCKGALDEANGDTEKAFELLRLKGLKGVTKREGRATSNGLVVARVSGGTGYLLELACETDFVAKNEKFVALADSVLAAIVAAGADSVDQALAASAGGGTVSSMIEDQAAIIGEKVELRRVAKLSGEGFAVYLHKTNKDLPPQVGVVVAYSGKDAETARSVAQHISFADPQYLSRDDVPAEAVETERRIVEEISRGEGKPEASLPKIVEGRVGAFFKQVALLEQEYARDNKLQVKQVLDQAGLVVSGFARFRVGA
jgi:elongation factor Ts